MVKKQMKLWIGLIVSLIVVGGCFEKRADYNAWSRKVAKLCQYVTPKDEGDGVERYHCAREPEKFEVYIIIHPDYVFPDNLKNPIVAYDGDAGVVMIGGKEKGQIWRMRDFELWELVKEPKVGMKEVYYDKEVKALIAFELGDDRKNVKSMAWWSTDAGKTWERKGVSNPVVDSKLTLDKPNLLPIGAISGADGNGWAIAIGKDGIKATIWRSVAKLPRVWTEVPAAAISDPYAPYASGLPASLQKPSPNELADISFDTTKKVFITTEKNGDIWESKNDGQTWQVKDFMKGTGTAIDPYQVASARHLWLVREHLDKHFKQTQDIDLSSVNNFDPIGEDWRNKFTGTFNGDGNVIKNLKINRPSKDYVGLFGYTDSRSEVRNVGLKNVNVRGKKYVGGLVGNNEVGTITNSYATGDVKGYGHVGGLVGYNYKGTIKESYATGSVTGKYNVGGLVGYNGSGGTIKESYATGDVTGTKKQVGGLVGVNVRGTIKESYAIGSVTGNNKVGGLVGVNVVTGRITGRNYWRTQGSLKGVGSGSGAVEEKTDAELKALDAAATGWDTNIWKFESGEYPKLKWQK